MKAKMPTTVATAEAKPVVVPKLQQLFPCLEVVSAYESGVTFPFSPNNIP